MRFHCLALPHAVTSDEYCSCAYTAKVLKFCAVMSRRGHHVIHYGHEDSDVVCTEHVTLITNEDLRTAYGSYDWKREFFRFDASDHCHTKFNELGSREVLKRLQDDDFVLVFWGHGHSGIANAVTETGKGFVVEPGIGYHSAYCQFRVYESYAILHHTMGEQQNRLPSWYHVVIPNYFNPDQFDYKEEKDDYFLCLGRISDCKGVNVAVQASEKLKTRLLIAGQGDPTPYLTAPNIEYVGYADVEKRRRLLSNAKALLIFSNYVEPFGGVTIEALLSGTPVICPDWGVFAETILHGQVGYRVRTFGQILWAMNNVQRISPRDCRDYAVRTFGLHKVARMYEEYFSNILHLRADGWYETAPRSDLMYLERALPRFRPHRIQADVDMPVLQYIHDMQLVNADADVHVVGSDFEGGFEPNQLQLVTRAGVKPRGRHAVLAPEMQRIYPLAELLPAGFADPPCKVQVSQIKTVGSSSCPLVVEVAKVCGLAHTDLSPEVVMSESWSEVIDAVARGSCVISSCPEHKKFIPSIMIYRDVPSAVELISRLQKSHSEYVAQVYEEVLTKWSWRAVAEKWHTSLLM